MSTDVNLQDLALSVSEEVRKEVNWSFAIADKLDGLLREKHISQKELARRLGKTESEVSRWLSGTHNFTLRTIAKISEAVGEDLIQV